MVIKTIFKTSVLTIFACSLLACASSHRLTPRVMSELAQSKRYFDDGYYKRAMHTLLPLASDGNPQAQYAVGYMYYYGLGVAQDTDTGYFWVKKAADQHYPAANEALKIMLPWVDPGAVRGKSVLVPAHAVLPHEEAIPLRGAG